MIEAEEDLEKIRKHEESLDNNKNCKNEGSDAHGTDTVVFETRQLWWQLHSKMREKPEYEKMLLLVRMKDHLEKLVYRRQRLLTYQGFESIVKKLHLDTEGLVIEPFVALADQEDRDERQRIWYENLALDLEEECLIK